MPVTTQRLTDFERRLHALELELDELKREDVAPPRPVPAPAARSERPAPPPPLAPRRPVVEREAIAARLAAVDLLGPRSLAWAGGIVTLLGVVLLFALAADRGWIGHETRVALGGIASALVFGAGVLLRRRFGAGYSALAAVGAGLAGGYATLLAATALYGLVPPWAALAGATAIAATGVWTAVAWRAQLVAGLGLVGALLVPLAYLVDGSLTTTGTGFAAFVFAGAAAVAIVQGWRPLLVVSVAASLPQIAVLVADRHEGAVALAVIFWLLYLGAGLALQLRERRTDLSGLPGWLVVLSAAFCSLAELALFDGDARGFVLLGAAAAYLAPALAFRHVRRNLASLLGLVAAAFVAIAAADLLSGTTLALVWAAQSAQLAWLSHRIGERRLQVGAFGYLGLGLVHALAFDAPPVRLLVEGGHVAHGAPTLLGLAAAALVASRHGDAYVRRTCVALAGVLSLYAGALALVAAAGFEWGHVAVTGTWALAGLAALAAGIARGSRELPIAARAWIGVVLLKIVGFDVWVLPNVQGSWALLAAAGSVLAAAYLNERARRGDLELDSAVGIVASVGLSVAGVAGLATGTVEGFALLGIAAIHGVAAAGLFRGRRDASTLLWGAALAVAAAGCAILLSGTALVAAWSAIAVALAWLALRVRDRRLAHGGGALVVLPLAHALVLDAPPSALLEASRHPAAGAAAILLAAVALAVIRRLGAIDPRSDWLAGALGLYALSLGLLEVALRAGASFATGHVLVSATWALVALTLLVRRPLRRAGTVLFLAVLAKIFLYDLASLPALTRTASFLAVGAALLAGGFFVQRASKGDPIDD